MATQKQYEAITKAIIEALESGTVPWRKPWNSPEGNAFPHNASTGRRYHGLNVLNLWAIALKNGYESQAWLTEKQAISLGGKQKEGERYHFVYWYDFPKVDTGKNDSKGEPILKTIPIFKMSKVYNVEQCEGIKLPKRELVTDTPTDTFNPIDEAEAIASAFIANGGPSVDHNGGDRAFYRPSEHAVHMPKQAQFEETGEYYSTLFHELTHSTGHKTLLGRFEETSEPVHFGSERYSKEELVAEFGNAFLCAEVGISNETIDNSASYIQNWLQALRSDYKLALVAASKAQKAVDLILGARV